MGANQTIPLRLAATFGCHMRFIQKRIKKKHPRIKYIQRNMVGLLLSALPSINKARREIPGSDTKHGLSLLVLCSAPGGFFLG